MPAAPPRRKYAAPSRAPASAWIDERRRAGVGSLMDHVANYPVVRKLGEGATSEVFLCQDPFRGRQVAVKRIFPESLRDPARGRLFRKLFFTEASLAGKLDHPHVAQIYDAGIGEDSGYIVMEFVPGGTMERFCAQDALLPLEQ